jgi:predicted dehydrogenase
MTRFGIIGFGRHAAKRLMPGIALAKNAQVTALSRRDIVAASEAAREFSVPLAFAYADNEKLCRSQEVDAVFVASADAMHLPDVLTAIRCGKPVLCEKPMAANLTDARRMFHAAKGADVLLGVAHVFRFADSVLRVRDIIAAREIGEVVSVQAHFHFNGLGHPRTWMIDPKLAAGGPLADIGVHCFDTLRFVLRDEIAKVSTVARRDDYSGPFEAAAEVAVEFEHGAIGSVSVSTRAEYATGMIVHGSKGTIRAPGLFTLDGPCTVYVKSAAKGWQNFELSNQFAFARQFDAFADTVEGRAQFCCPGEEGLRNQLVLDAAYRSMMSWCVERV